MLILVGDASRSGTFGCGWILAWQIPDPARLAGPTTVGRADVKRMAEARFCGVFGCTERAFSRTQSTVQYVQLNVNIGISREHFQVVKFDHPPCGFLGRKPKHGKGLRSGESREEAKWQKNSLGEIPMPSIVAVYSPAAYRLALHPGGTDGTEK